ncbi:MAG: DegT/DnrJ/EryC1/StrS family aminotransferase [Candidatus Eisenbacteria bacterium]|nr:DegT/DnrJ/EryC1/StrS family aminotransferase [Candidatus Eisenbacteria bacterium]
MVPFLDLARQYDAIKEEIDQSIKRVLDSGWFVLGEEVLGLEREFAEYCGAKYAVGVGSGTEALHLALLACGVEFDDEVITVANTAVPTISAISFANAAPVLVDVRADTLLMDASLIEEKITDRTKVILPVHLYGQSADMDAILRIAGKHGLKVIEDACQAHGSLYRDRKAGTMGNLGCFSFYPSKNLGCYGDGGMVVTDSEEYCERLKLLRNYGQKTRYFHEIKGFNSRLDELQAAILRVKLRKLDGWNERRRVVAKTYHEGLSENTDCVLPVEQPETRGNHHLYVIRHPERDRLQEWLKKNGVATLVHYPVPVHLQEAYRDLGLREGDLPVTEAAAKRIVSLPIFPEILDSEVEEVVKRVNDF